MRTDYPCGWYGYVVLIGASSLLTLFGFHRWFYSLLAYLPLPDMVVSCLTGIMNLAWYELGYVVGGGMKNVAAFDAIPMLGVGLGLLSAALLLTRFRLRRHIVLAFLTCCIALAALSGVVLSWRLWRGIDDLWRLTTTVAFLIAHLMWLLYFQRTKRFFSGPL